jgi:hypothetical protein
MKSILKIQQNPEFAEDKKKKIVTRLNPIFISPPSLLLNK